ncbi:hypothetical protein PIB30_036957 [Stylosanthes scabra]|uniref:Uncharacterized protein n=1 Tax=Stylosanthes scabra TaxID=79078 RepID=A0ABU6VBU3_9FABA|nr:hypothetical protein [Stylosanthes scabra]
MRDKEGIIMARNNGIKLAVAILMFEMLVCCVIAKLHENNPLEESSPPTLPEFKPPPEDKFEYDNDESELPECIEICKREYIFYPEELMDCIEVCYRNIYD